MKSLIAHLFGDYVLQTSWEANEKTNSAVPAAVHAAKYAACFVPLTRDWKKLALIGGTHYLIDRYRLAKYVAWAKNQAAPAAYRYPLDADAWNNGGYSTDTPVWLSTWLMIAADNAIHMLINEIVLET